MTEDELRSFIELQESRADRPEVAAEQAQAMDYYLRRPFGNEEEGRSQVISSDVWDVVEGMTPVLLKPFVSSADVVQFNPVGPEDEEAAKQETDYLNYVVTQRNDSFTQMVAWAKAGLLQKNGVVKYWWDTTRRVSIETYEDLTEDVLTSMLQQDGISVLEQTKRPPRVEVGPDGMPVEVTTYDVRLRVVETEGLARYKLVMPESIRIIGDDPNPQRATFFEHIEAKTLSDLREMGYDVEDDISDAGTGDTLLSPQAAARQSDGTFETTLSDGNGDPSMREVWFREAFCRVDFDGDGVAELRKVCLVGTNVLANDEVEEINFCAWTPYQQLGKFDGRCPADETIEIQDIKSTLWRQNLDNLYTVGNNRVYAGSKVNLDDLLDNQIAGIVRVESDIVEGHVKAIPVQPLGQIIMPMIEYTDGAKENRTGWTRYNQGASDLNNQKTLGEVRLTMGAGSERLALIQRALAEQGVKPLMIGLHGLLRRHATKNDTVKLRGKWVDVDPRQWKKRYDMTVSVGLGTMDKSMELGAQQGIIAAQKEAFAVGVVTPENVYNAHVKLVELTGEKATDKYFTHPDKMPKPEPPDPMQNPEFMLQVKESKQKDRELEQKDYALKQDDRRIAQDDIRLGLERAQAQIDALSKRHEMQLETDRHKRDMRAPHPQELAAAKQATESQTANEQA